MHLFQNHLIGLKHCFYIKRELLIKKHQERIANIVILSRGSINWVKNVCIHASKPLCCLQKGIDDPRLGESKHQSCGL